MRRRGERAPREKAVADEEVKSAERKAEQGTEEYQCTGVLEQDFPELCARAGIAGVPKVTLRPSPSFPADEEAAEPTLPEVLAGIEHKYGSFQPCIQVEREHEDPQSVRAVFLRGWKMEEDMLGVLSQCLPALAGLQAVHLWKVGLTERLLPALAALVARCPRLRTLSLEGTPLPELAFQALMGSDSTLTHLSLRHTGIGDAAAELIGQSLSTPRSSNRSLVSLVLSFNRISDLGAGYIAQGLRLNRSLLSLSLANNAIGDAGAIKLAEVLGPFALTHAEVVERRRLLLAEALGRSHTTLKEMEGQSEHPSGLRGGTAPDKLPPAKHGKPPTKKKDSLRKEEAKQPKKPPELRAARGRDAKQSGQEKPSPEAPDPAEPLHPLLEEARPQQGSVVLPGNRALLNLNLTYNHVTERGLGAFLAALEEQQREKKPKVPGRQGLLCLSLQVSRLGGGAGIAVGLASPPGPQRGRHRHQAHGGASPWGWHHRGVGIAMGLALLWGWHSHQEHGRAPPWKRHRHWACGRADIATRHTVGPALPRDWHCRRAQRDAPLPRRRTASLPPARPFRGSRSCCHRGTPSPKRRARRRSRNWAPNRCPRNCGRSRGRSRARFLSFL